MAWPKGLKKKPGKAMEASVLPQPELVTGQILPEQKTIPKVVVGHYVAVDYIDQKTHERVVKSAYVYHCDICGSYNYRAIGLGGVCDECILNAAKEIQEAFRLLHGDEIGEIKIDLEHYPIEDHADFYGLVYDKEADTWSRK